MATSQQQLVCDTSTTANFKSWASAVSNAIRAFGWTNSSDTGQLNGAGGNNWAGVSTTPAGSAFYYEIFQPGDGLTNFYLKVEYGNFSTSPTPGMRWSIGTTTNGAGTLTGYVTALINPLIFGNSAPSSSTTYECNFSGDSGRLCIMMWRNSPSASNTTSAEIFCVQRSLNGSGSPTGTYVTLWTVGGSNGNSSESSGSQQTIHFVAGVSTLFSNRSSGTSTGIPCIGCNFVNSSSSSAFNGGIGMSTPQPYVGFWDYPCTVIGAALGADIAEGVTFSVTNQYGQTKTYMPTKARAINYAFVSMFGLAAVCMEYD